MGYLYYNSETSLLKTKFMDGVEAGAIPNTDKLAMDFKLEPQMNPGKEVEKSVMVQAPQGVSFIGSDDTGSAYNTSRPGKWVSATAKTTSMVLPGMIAQDLLDRIEVSDGAFVNGVKPVMKEYLKQLGAIRDMMLYHGGSYVFQLESSVTSGSSTGTQVWQVTKATHSPSLIKRLLGAELDIYTTTTKVNTNQAVVLSSYDQANRRVTLTGNSTDLDAAGDGEIYLVGQYGNVHLGMNYVVGSTSLTDLYGINQTTYPLFKSNSVALGSQILSYRTLADGVATLEDQGVSGMLNLYCSSKTATDLRTDLMRETAKKSAKVIFDKTMSVLVFDDIKVRIRSHMFAHPGSACLCAPSAFVRLGQDIKFMNLAGKGEESYLMPDKDNHGAWFKGFFRQALVCTIPSHTLKFTGILNQADA